MAFPKIDAREIAEKIGVPLEAWAGNCHGISDMIVRTDALRSIGGPDTDYRVVRGHWNGPIARNGHFGYRVGLPFIQHSWIRAHGLVIAELPPPVTWPHPKHPEPTIEVVHNPVIDPTRFAIDGQEPYIYIGPNDYYDAGGNSWRMATMEPCPPFDPKHKVVSLPMLPAHTERWIALQVTGKGYPYGYYTVILCMWLANLPLTYMGSHARPIFSALVAAGLEGFIPMDNKSIVMQG